MKWIKTNTLGSVWGDLVPKFKESNSTVADTYWLNHTVTLTITMYDSDEAELETHSFQSTTIPHMGTNFGKLTIQYIDRNGLLSDETPNAFEIFTQEGDIFSPESRTACASFRIELSCDGYKTIEKTYQI